ncbi:MAG: hypothetical protein QOI98_48 [Solirubrobacteraceae bacterium]|nr:hypothetical protein [Solirubrobacteraceae bacterium]
MLTVWDAYAGPTLGDALASLRSQDVASRILVVDNASSVPIAQEDGIEFLRSPTRIPLGAARNLGLAHVTTPYVVVWDADDVMLPGTLALLERGLEADGSLVAYAAAIVEGPEGPRHQWPRRRLARLVRHRRLFALMHSVWSLYPSTGATIMRTEAVRAAGGYPSTHSGEDWVLGVSLAFRGGLGWTERPGRVYRRHGRSVWAQHARAGDLLGHARAVRARLLADPAVPRWVRVALPVIGAAQRTAIVISRTRRRVVSSRRAGPELDRSASRR